MPTAAWTRMASKAEADVDCATANDGAAKAKTSAMKRTRGGGMASLVGGGAAASHGVAVPWNTDGQTRLRQAFTTGGGAERPQRADLLTIEWGFEAIRRWWRDGRLGKSPRPVPVH